MVSVHVHLFVKKAVVWREFSPVSFFFFFFYIRTTRTHVSFF